MCGAEGALVDGKGLTSRLAVRPVCCSRHACDGGGRCIHGCRTWPSTFYAARDCSILSTSGTLFCFLLAMESFCCFFFCSYSLWVDHDLRVIGCGRNVGPRVRVRGTHRRPSALRLKSIMVIIESGDGGGGAERDDAAAQRTRAEDADRHGYHRQG